MDTDMGASFTQLGGILSAMADAHAQTARAVTRLLDRDALDDDDRAELRRSVTASITTLARQIEAFLPGQGDALLRHYSELTDEP